MSKEPSKPFHRCVVIGPTQESLITQVWSLLLHASRPGISGMVDTCGALVKVCRNKRERERERKRERGLYLFLFPEQLIVAENERSC